MININTVNLVSSFLEFTLFGIFVLLSPVSLVLLARRHRKVYGQSHELSDDAPRWRNRLSTTWGLRRSPLILANVLLMLTVTVHFGYSAKRIILAMVNEGGGEAAVLFFTDLRERTQVARLILLVIDMFLGDVVITYRVWLVWGKNYWITLFPVLTVIGVIVAGSGMVHQFTLSHSDTGVFTEAVAPWITATCVTTVWCVDNMYLSAVIGYRVWTSNRLLRNTGVLGDGRSLLNSMAILVESAAFWTSWVVLYLIWYLTGSPLEAIGSGTAPVVIGITFMLITVRVGLGLGQETRPTTASMQWAKTSSSFTRGRGLRLREDLHRPQAISLTVTRTVERGDEADVEESSIGDNTKAANSLPQRSGDTFEGTV
ncbi:hypothetical protein BD311DRAFT_664523 [Dichomitus squalens]|uniref:Uncharacterized protein n=1 Tax=Dichomitus squalens TaxID=114155 RepID=A0A4Q9MKE8_9APHY|nr:hypothetical protein BD311DRAFT_664523 [Dichomitus squalens]